MQTQSCDRACLQAIMDSYLAAMAARDPSRLPLADGYKYTENTAQIPIGDGLWAGCTGGPTAFQIVALDPVAGQAGFLGLMQEIDHPSLLSVRLKIVDRKITEIEHVVARRLQERALANLVAPRPGFLQPVPPAERNSRAEMQRIADSYFDSIEQCNGDVAPFADESVRHENGIQTTNNQPPDPAAFGSSPSEQDRLIMARIDALSVRDQMNCRILSYITRIRPRHLLIVDEELGLVYGFPKFVHRGNVRRIKIVGVPGVDTAPRHVDPFDLMAGEIFKIRGGKIYEIEANGCLVPYNCKTGWEEEYGAEMPA